MNAPRDPWIDFAEVFAEELAAPLTTEQMDAMADDYAREQMAGANSGTGSVDAAGTYAGHD